MAKYEEVVAAAAAGKLDRDISNSTMLHAGIAALHLLKNAGQHAGAKHVRIVSTCFYDQFWNKRLDDLLSYLSHDNARISVLVLNPDEDDNGVTMLRALARAFPGQVDLHRIDGARLREKTEWQMDQIPNFCVVDPVGYRFETADSNRANDVVTGIINFGGQKTTDTLRRTFDYLVAEASEAL